MFRQYKLRNYSFPLIAAVIALSVIGIMVIGVVAGLLGIFG